MSLTYPNIDPVAFKIGSLAIYWYGVMHLVGFAGIFALCYQRRRVAVPPWKTNDIIDLLFYMAVGGIFGGAWGFILFYNPAILLEDPWRALQFWEPGRSFHGGLLGVLLAVAVFCRLNGRRFLEVTDFIAPAVPLGLAAGRLGNFINGELWGRITDMPWGMVFPGADGRARHPSQLYEFALEGLLLFIILSVYSRKPRARGVISGMFLALYGIFRGWVECVREPDISHGFIAFGWVTMGQMLSLPMLLGGIGLIGYAIRQKTLQTKRVI